MSNQHRASINKRQKSLRGPCSAMQSYIPLEWAARTQALRVERPPRGICANARTRADCMPTPTSVHDCWLTRGTWPTPTSDSPHTVARVQGRCCGARLVPTRTGAVVMVVVAARAMTVILSQPQQLPPLCSRPHSRATEAALKVAQRQRGALLGSCWLPWAVSLAACRSARARTCRFRPR